MDPNQQQPSNGYSPAGYRAPSQQPTAPLPPPLATPPAPPPSAVEPSQVSRAPELPQNPNTSQPQVAQQPQQPTARQQQPQPTAPAQYAPPANKTSTQNVLEIAEVRDGIAIMNDGSFRAVVMCQSINFDLMAPDEREAVEYAYQGFLNSLYFDIQIFIRSQKVDLRPYLTKLDRIRSEHENMLLALLMEDYIGYMAAVAQQTNIMDKKFYIVIDYRVKVESGKAVNAGKGFLSTIFGSKKSSVVINEADMVAAKTELKNRIQTVMAGLQQCGVNSIPLDTEELIELYYDAYNPDTATRQKMKSFHDISAPVVTKGKGAAPQPSFNKELM